MDLISCDNCGVVLDKSKKLFPEDIHNKNRSINMDLAEWDGKGFTAKINCPVCKMVILDVD